MTSVGGTFENEFGINFKFIKYLKECCVFDFDYCSFRYSLSHLYVLYYEKTSEDKIDIILYFPKPSVLIKMLRKDMAAKFAIPFFHKSCSHLLLLLH